MGGSVLRVEGYALVLGDDVDTDTIIPSTFLHYSEPEKLAEGVFAKAPEIRGRLDRLPRPVVIVAGRGFGYGSSREHAVIALKAAGVAAVVAESFHRIFYRNAVNNGLLVVEAQGLRGRVRDGDRVVVDLEQGYVEAAGVRVEVQPLPGEVARILREGGLRGVLRRLAAAAPVGGGGGER